MRNDFNYEFLADRSDLNPEEEAEFRQHVREIIEESKADNPDGLSIPDIYERLRRRQMRQLVDSMVRDGGMVHFECCDTYTLSSMVRSGRFASCRCGCNVIGKQE